MVGEVWVVSGYHQESSTTTTTVTVTTRLLMVSPNPGFFVKNFTGDIWDTKQILVELYRRRH